MEFDIYMGEGTAIAQNNLSIPLRLDFVACPEPAEGRETALTALEETVLSPDLDLLCLLCAFA